MKFDVGSKKLPPVVQKALAFKQIKFKDGKIMIWDLGGSLYPYFSQIFFWKLMEDQINYKKTMSLLYNWGKFHGYQTYRMISERFGYAKKISDKRKLLEFSTGQTEMVGLGIWNWTTIDYKNKIFKFKGTSPFAEEYRKLFGPQKHPVDHWLRGNLESYVSLNIGEECFCAETSCMAMGKHFCELTIKPISGWDFNDPKIKSQIIQKMPSSMKNLGGSSEPHLANI